MGSLRWIPPVLLTVVLAASAGTKLAAPRRTRESFEGLGLPAAGILAVAVPLAELVTAVLLIATTRIGGLLAFALLISFTAFLSWQVAQGSTKPCACFGQVRLAPISTADLARNGVLLALALITVASASRPDQGRRELSPGQIGPDPATTTDLEGIPNACVRYSLNLGCVEWSSGVVDQAKAAGRDGGLDGG